MNFGIGAFLGALIALPPALTYILYKLSTLCDDARLFNPCYPDTTMTTAAVIAALMVLGLATVGGLLGIAFTKLTGLSASSSRERRRAVNSPRYEDETYLTGQEAIERKERREVTRRRTDDPVSAFIAPRRATEQVEEGLSTNTETDDGQTHSEQCDWLASRAAEDEEDDIPAR